MKKLILLFAITTFQSVALAQSSQDCSGGKYFDSSLNRCVLSTQTVDSKVKPLSCDGLTGEAAKACFKNIVDGEVSELEASGKVESAKNPKGSMIIPAIVTLGSAYYLFMGSENLKKCGSISIYLMLGGGVTTLLGEFLAQRKYKSKLKKMEKSYKEKTAESNSAKDNDNLETINTNQTTAFDYQIEQERARESAHKMRKTVYTLATGLYAGATVAAIYEAVTKGITPTPNGCSGDRTPVAPTTPAADGTGFYTPIDQGSNSEVAMSAMPKLFIDYSYIKNFEATEVAEIIFRKLADIIIPTAEAQALILPAVTAAPGFMEVAGQASEAAAGVDKVGAFDKIAGSPIFRAAISGILTIYSKKIASKAKKLAKEAAERAEAIEELRDNFLANGGAGFENCTESQRTKVSMPMCYCYQADGSRNPSRAKSPTCLSVYGASGGVLTSAGKYDKNFSGMPYDSKGCLSNLGNLDESCACKKTNSCSTIQGSLNLGGLSSIDGLSKTVGDASSFTSGNISAGDINTASLERAVANIRAQQDKLEGNPKSAGAVKKANDLGFKLEKSFGRSIQNAANKGSISPELASFSGGGLNGGDSNDSGSSDLNSIKLGVEKTFDTPSSTLTSGGTTGVTIDDFDFSSKNTGGVAIQEGTGDIMDKEFKVDDISNNSSASIFSIISNRYQTTGLRTLFSDEKKSNEN